MRETEEVHHHTGMFQGYRGRLVEDDMAGEYKGHCHDNERGKGDISI